MVHIYNGILLSHKKGQNCIICRPMDWPRDYHTEWCMSEKQICYVAHMWNLEKLHR